LTVTQISSKNKETLVIIQAFFNFYISVTQNHPKIFLHDEKIHAEWLEIGSKIIDIKSMLSHENNTEDIGDNKKPTRDCARAHARSAVFNSVKSGRWPALMITMKLTVMIAGRDD
jgi:hypothetical protein